MEQWSAHNEKALIALDIRTMDEAPLTAAEINLHLPSIRLARVRGSAQVIERNESYIRKHPMGIVGVFFALKGEAFFYHPGGFETLRPGQAVFYDVDRPFMRGFHSGVEEMVLTIRREDFLALSGGKELTRPVVYNFHDDGPANRHMLALAKLVRDALAAGSRSGSDAASTKAPDVAAVEATAVELVRLLVAAQGSGTSEGYAAAAKCFIEGHLADPELSPARIAQAVGVSERHLTRVFTEIGEPPGAYMYWPAGWIGRKPSSPTHQRMRHRLQPWPPVADSRRRLTSPVPSKHASAPHRSKPAAKTAPQGLFSRSDTACPHPSRVFFTGHRLSSGRVFALTGHLFAASGQIVVLLWPAQV